MWPPPRVMVKKKGGSEMSGDAYAYNSQVVSEMFFWPYVENGSKQKGSPKMGPEKNGSKKRVQTKWVQRKRVQKWATKNTFFARAARVRTAQRVPEKSTSKKSWFFMIVHDFSTIFQ